VTAGKVADDQRAAARKTLLQALEYASDKAEGTGLTVVIEALNPNDVPGAYLNTSELAASIVNELGRPNVKFLFDCYHVQIVEGDLTRRLEKLMPIIGHIQVAAVPSRAEPDEGEIAYGWLLQRIDTLGYRGFIGAEYRPRGEVEKGLSWLMGVRAAMR
jgi:hydroxypyruvate isomerase